jgi:hypothetical protein
LLVRDLLLLRMMASPARKCCSRTE